MSWDKHRAQGFMFLSLEKSTVQCSGEVYGNGNHYDLLETLSPLLYAQNKKLSSLMVLMSCWKLEQFEHNVNSK